jgi:hypothetical protein
MIGAKAGKARRTGARHGIRGHLIGLHLRDQEYALAQTRDRTPD